MSKAAGRMSFVINIKPDEVHCKLKHYIYLQTSKHFGITYVLESITPLNLKLIFSIWVFFHKHSRITGQQEKGKAISNSSLPLPLATQTLRH